MNSVAGTILTVFVFKVVHGVIVLTWFCKLLTRVAILSGGGGHVPQVTQWHDASECIPLKDQPIVTACQYYD